MHNLVFISEQDREFGPGMCVAVGEHNGYDDSDFYGIFAKPAEGGGFTFSKVTVGSTRHAGGFIPHVDATEEVFAAYEPAREAVFAKMRAERAAEEAKIPTEGKPVTVVKPPTRGKNKMPAGVTGVVKRRVKNQFDSAWAIRHDQGRTYRLLVDIEERGEVWLDEERVRVQGHEDEEIGQVFLSVEYLIAASWPAPQKARVRR